MVVRHKEHHHISRIGWLRAAVLGANDGILSTASLVLGVAAAQATRHNILIAGVAGLVAGSMSMAAGEYVSVHSQADTEKADLARESAELEADDRGEHEELAAIYIDPVVVFVAVVENLDSPDLQMVTCQVVFHPATGVPKRHIFYHNLAAIDHLDQVRTVVLHSRGGFVGKEPALSIDFTLSGDKIIQ